MSEDFILALLCAALVALSLMGVVMVFPTINMKLGTKRAVKALVKGKKLEDQKYSFTPTEADIPRHGNNLVYRLYVEVEGRSYDLLTTPKGYLATTVGQSLSVYLYQGKFFGKKYVEWR